MNTDTRPSPFPTVFLFTLILLTIGVAPPITAAPVGTAFHYQGYIEDDGLPANGPYDFEFRMFGQVTGGAALAGAVTLDDVEVTNGLFAAQLDFGAGVFTGDARWLELSIRPGASAGAYDLMSPRQELLPVPYALHATQAPLPNLVSSESLSIGVFHALPLGIHASITGGGNNEASGPSSLVGGGSANRATQVGAAVVAGSLNEAKASYATVGGGLRNEVTGSTGFIGGGTDNQVLVHYSFIGAGRSNVTHSGENFVGAGRGNSANGDFSAIAGGFHNAITKSEGFVGSGSRNLVAGSKAVVVGGLSNSNHADRAFLGGGEDNRILFGHDGVLVGGSANELLAAGGMVGGGEHNRVELSADHATLSGGRSNRVFTSAVGATIPGGVLNRVSQPFGFAAGLQAHSLHAGSFVWADSSGPVFASTTSNQFCVRATGGIHFETAGAGIFVDGQPVDGGAGETNHPLPALIVAKQLNVGTNHLLTGECSGITGGRHNTNQAAFAIIGGGFTNTIFSSGLHGVIGGGRVNELGGSDNTIGGGQANIIRDPANSSVIGGGIFNVISSNGSLSTIAGGKGNLIDTGNGAIGGGINNMIHYFASASTIAGGLFNVVESNATSSTISGGQFNRIEANTEYSSIGGGLNCQILEQAKHATIGGGHYIFVGDEYSTGSGGIENRVMSGYSVISGGATNRIDAGSQYSGIASGMRNLIRSNAHYAVIPGGLSNRVSGSYAWAAGRQAEANHPGSFVWADGSGDPFASTADNQFSVRATGGVRIVTGGAHSTMDAPLGIGRDPTANALEVEGEASNSTGGAWKVNSDRRIKTKIRSLDDSLAVIERLRPVGFEFTEEYLARHPKIAQREYYNVVAQEYAEVFPDYVKPSGEPDILQVDPYPMLVHSVGAVKQLHEIVKAKDARIQELQERLERLEQAVFKPRNDGGAQ